MSTGRLGAGDTAIQPTLLDAKGDLIAATAADTPARLAVGANGESLVADSSTATGLRWQGSFEAGKNKIINGDFGIWQRGTSFTGTGYTYTADRWMVYGYASNSVTASRQTFTTGTAPVAGYEGTYFIRINSTNFQTWMAQRIEDVRMLAGQTVTLSFWAKAASGGVSIRGIFFQDFGASGSTGVGTDFATQTIGTTWTRYSATITVPSISGKAIGTNSNVELAIVASTINNNVDIWGVQIEAGAVATPFQTATGTLQGELAACQRYYWRQTGPNAYSTYGFGSGLNSTTAYFFVQNPVPMRIAPTVLEYASLGIHDKNVSIVSVTALTIANNSNIGTEINATSSGLTQYRPYMLCNNNNATGYIGLSAEL